MSPEERRAPPARLRHHPESGEIAHVLLHYLGDIVLGTSDGVITTFAVVSGVAGARLEPRVVVILGAAKLLADGFSMASSNFLAIRSGAEAQSARRGVIEPLCHALFTFLAFVLLGSVALLGYLIPGDPDKAFAASAACCAAVLLAVGWVRARLVGRRPVLGGLEMVSVGAVAGAIAYWGGAVVGRWIG